MSDPEPSIRDIQEISADRAKRWHKGGIEEWTVLEWAGAMCGEAGEAANVAKKIRRHDLEAWNGTATKSNPLDRASLRKKLAQELADTILYAVLVAEREGLDLHHAVIEIFNLKSKEAGFPERL